MPSSNSMAMLIVSLGRPSKRNGLRFTNWATKYDALVVVPNYTGLYCLNYYTGFRSCIKKWTTFLAFLLILSCTDLLGLLLLAIL